MHSMNNFDCTVQCLTRAKWFKFEKMCTRLKPTEKRNGKKIKYTMFQRHKLCMNVFHKSESGNHYLLCAMHVSVCVCVRD